MHAYICTHTKLSIFFNSLSILLPDFHCRSNNVFGSVDEHTVNCKPTLLTRVTCLFFTSHVMHKPPAIQLMPATNLFKPVSHPSSNTLFTTDHLGTMQEHYNPCIRCTHCTSPCSQQLCTQSSCKKTVPIHLWLSILW